MALAGLALASLAACQGLIGDPGARPAPAATNPPSGPRQLPDGRYVCDDAVHATAMPLRRLTPAQYRNTIRDVFEGRVAPSDNFPLGGDVRRASATGFSTEPGLYPVDNASIEQIMTAAEDVGVAVADALGDLLPCSAQPSPDEACAQMFIDRYAARAYRRPLQPDETATLLAAYRTMRDGGGGFGDGVAAMTTAMLQTAQFLYLPEAGAQPSTGAAAAAVIALTDHEIAARLAYLLWDAPPDDTLRAAADAGALHTAEQISAQARRMLMDGRAEPALARFFREWMHIDTVAAGGRDPMHFPEFDAGLAASIQTGFARYATGVVQNGRTLRDLLTTPETWVNARLAAYFGLPASLTPPSDDVWTRVALDPSRYAGLLTQPAVMAGLAHPTETSYVRRGVAIRTQLLCETALTPPGNALTEFNMIGIPPGSPARTISASVQARGTCGACHRGIDPAGLAFENFDAIGRYGQSDVFGNAVDPSGEVTFGPVDPITFRFTGAVDLMRQLADSGRVEPCVARQFTRFAFARLEATTDACVLQALTDRLRASGASLSDVLVALTTADGFRFRLAGDAP